MTEPTVEVLAPENLSERGQLTSHANSYLRLAEDMVIETEQDFLTADKLRQEGMTQRKKIEAHHKPRIDQAHKLHRGLISDMNIFYVPIEKARKLFGDKMTVFRAGQRKIQLAVEVAQEKERADEQARLTKLAEDKRVEQARVSEAKGNKVEADAILETPAEVHQVPVGPISQPAVPKSQTKFKDTWDVIVINPAEVPEDYKDINQGRLDKFARLMKGKVQIAGCRIDTRTIPC